MKILVVDDDRGLREVMVVILENELQAEVLEASSSLEAIQLIQKNLDLDCVICDYSLKDGNGGDVFKYMLSVHSKVPYVLCSSEIPSDHEEFYGKPLAGFIEKPFLIEPLKELLKKIVKKSGIGNSPKVPPYFRIKSSAILKLNFLYSDLYIRISASKFVKLLRSGEVLSDPDIKKLASKKIDYFYVRQKDYKPFLKKMAKDLSYLSESKGVKTQSAFEIAGAVHEMTHKMVAELGVAPEITALIQSTVELALRVIKRNQNLAQLLKLFISDQHHFLSSHSILLSYIAPSIASLVGLNSEVTFIKLIYAAFFHDITVNNSDLARLNTLAELEEIETGFSEKELHNFRSHPWDAAILVKEMSEMPSDVETILLQHHERPDGTGFPEGLKAVKINPLSVVFIIAEELVRRVLEKEGKLTLKGDLQEMSQRYKDGLFKKTILAVLSSIHARR